MSSALRGLRRNWALVLALTTLGVVAAGVLTARTPATYNSSIKLFVTATRPTDTASAYEGNLFSQARVASYAEILTSRGLAQQVVAEAALPLTADAVAAEVTAVPVPNTVVLDVTVTDSFPRRAQLIAASLGRVFTARVTELETPPGASTSTVAVRTIQSAGYDPTPIGPDMTGNLGRGGAIGLVVGLMLALLRGRLDHRVRTVEDIDEAAGVGMLGRTYASRQLSRKHLVTALPADSLSLDAFRAMGAALRQTEHRVLLVGGCLPGDGASTVAVNLAVSLTRAGGRVLIVDADLRRPRAARYLGLPDEPGLTEVLCDGTPLEAAVQQWGEEPLSILPAGTMHPNPGDLLGSARMHALLDELRASYDFVVIDAPPVAPVVDATVMGALADGCLLVTCYGKTKRERLAEAVDSLTMGHATVLGVVLNRLPRRDAVSPVARRASRPDTARAWTARAAVPTGAGGPTGHLESASSVAEQRNGAGWSPAPVRGSV